MDEWIDLYDRAGHVIDTCLRSQVNARRGLFLSVHLVVTDAQGRYLIHKRKNKAVDNGLWDIVTGVALSGEESATAAARELEEELGVDATRATFTFHGRVVGRHNLLDVYTVTLPADSVITPCEEEVETVRYVSAGDLADLFRASSKEEDYVALILRLLGET